MIPINSTYAPIQALVDELVRCGMRHAVTCPGSRNAPISLTLAASTELATISVLDERSAGFMALGIAKTSERPVAITTTSGTAAANLFPAVVEAHEAAVPLIVLTADRPPELRAVGAGQAIDQIKLYGDFVKWFAEVGNHPPGRASAIHHRQLACRAAWTAAAGRPGPVHLNFPLREPLAPSPEGGLDPADWAGRDRGRPWTELGLAQTGGSGDRGAELRRLLADAERGLIVCGASHDPGVGSSATELGRILGWPVLAEPTSGVRCPETALEPDPVIAHYDLLLRSQRFAAEMHPDVVVRVGEMPTSKPLRAWLEGCRQALVDPHLDWHDPTRGAESIWPFHPVSLLDDMPARPHDQAWIGRWREADALVPALLADSDEPFEPLAYNVLADIAETVWISSSMPIRDFESYFPHTPHAIALLANRGANGIDGVVSSAAGASLGTDAPVHLVIGELALLHDIGGLISARRAGVQLAILCVNNGGGGIFDFLPVAEAADPEAYESHIATPVDADLATAAALGGLEHHVVTTAEEVRAKLRPGTLVELRVARDESLRRHRELAERVRQAVEAAPGA